MIELKGAPVAAAIRDSVKGPVGRLRAEGIVPRLAVVRVGRREDTASYEREICRRFSAAGAEVDIVELPETASQERLEGAVQALNDDPGTHGILLLKPLPAGLSEEPLRRRIDERKDVDGIGYAGMARLFSGAEGGYPPCTAQAVVEILDGYGIGISGKKAVVVGRSLVVGRPAAMLLLRRDATVTICHTKTADLAKECRAADILVACAGVPGLITADHVRPGQVVVDVGIHMTQRGLCGDVEYPAVAAVAEAVTPVPGGVGAITVSVLLRHTVQSAIQTLPPLPPERAHAVE